MATFQKIDISNSHPMVAGMDLGPVGGQLRDKARRHSYWDPDVKFHSFRRRIGDSAFAPFISDTQFIESLYELAKGDPLMDPFEAKFKEAFGPYQQNDVPTFIKSLELYFTSSEHEIQPQIKSMLISAFKEVVDELLAVKTDEAPVSLEEAYGNMPSGTNSGLPYYTSRKWSKEMKDYYMKEASEILEGKVNMDQAWYVLGNRLQPKGLRNCKIRPFLGPKKSEYLAAQTVSIPLMRLMQKLECYQGYNGPHTLGPVFKRWFEDEAMELFISLDYSAYDATIVPFLMKLVLCAISTIFPESEKLCDALFLIYTEGGVMTPNFGKKKGLQIWLGSHGVPSGIGFTFATSLINRAVMKMYMKLMGITNYYHICNGDDTALCIGKDDMEKFSLSKLSEIAAQVGLVVNPDPRKQELCYKGKGNDLSKEAYITFLGRYFFESDQRGKMPIMRMAPGLFYWERYVHRNDFLNKLEWYQPGVHDASKIMMAADCITLIQKLENCKYHDKIKEFTHFVMLNTPGFLDPNLWVSDFADKIALITRTGRLSRLTGLLSYTSVRILFESHYTWMANTGKTVAQIFAEISQPSDGFPYGPFPDHEFIPDLRPEELMEERETQVLTTNTITAIEKPNTSVDPSTLSMETLMANVVNPETLLAAEEAKQKRKDNERSKKLRLHKLDRDDVVKQLKELELSNGSKVAIHKLKARISQLDLSIAELEELGAVDPSAKSEASGKGVKQ